MNKIIQDMIPPKEKPPLRESIPVEKTRKKIAQKPAPQKPPRPRSSSNGIVGRRTVRPWLFVVIAVVCVAAIVYAFSIVYARATVTVVPAEIDIPFSGTYTAYATTAASGTLAYKIIQTTGDKSQSIPASIGPALTAYAKGTVILYNNYGSASQKIIAGTRLSGGNGLIYTTNSSVIIPGISGGGGTAGSVAVAVTAAAGGASYNILPSDLTVNPAYGDFNIVAYKGGPKYAGFYARLNPAGAGITGGSSGRQIVTSSSTVSSAVQALKQALQLGLLSQAQALVPDGYVLFDNAYSISYAPATISTTSPTTANVGMTASLYGIIFKKADLAQTIAPTQYNNSFDPQDLQSSQFSVDNPQSFTVTNGSPLNFTLKGTLNLVGAFSTSTLARQLAGVSSADSASIFKDYGAIATAHVTMMPFWKRSFPASPSRINIIISQ